MYLNKLTVLLIVIVYFEVRETCHALIIIEGETKQHSKGIAEDTCKLECRGSICIDVNKYRYDTGFAIMKKGNPQCIPKCVSGYEYVDGVCKPQCSKPCLGGKCIAPDLCICPGDLKLIDGQCIPTCHPECGNGTCIDVNKCRCDTGFAIMKKGNPQCIPKCVSGYEYVDGVCKPQCSKPCLGGKCIAPDLCICPGDLKLIDGQCIPTCHPECGNGTCIDVNKCSCWYGYELRKSTNPQCVLKCDTGYDRINGRCQPRCTKPCYGGYCAAPEECLCHTGWKKNEQGECIPTCNPECGNGTCIAVNKCSCWYGYELRKSTNPQCVLKCISGYKMVDGICQPRCSKPCRGAKCLAPENCLCADGWELNNHRKCIPTCNPVCGSGGECVAPNKCRCKEPSITVYLTDDNQSCDCLDDCDIICNKTVCRSPREEGFRLFNTEIEIAHRNKTITLQLYTVPPNITFETQDSVAKTSTCSSNIVLLYSSVGANIILLLIVLTMVYIIAKQKYFRGSDRSNKLRNDYDYVVPVSQLPTDPDLYEEITPNKY